MTSQRLGTARWGLRPAIIVLAVFLLAMDSGKADEAEEGVLVCYGEFEGNIIEDASPSCYSDGFWRLSFEADTGSFNFHFHGATEDNEWFGFKERFSGWPEWVDDLSCFECGLCIVEADTRIHVNRRGRVLVTVHGFAFPCECGDEEAPTVVSVTAIDKTHVEVVFSEPMDKTSVETFGNYSIVPPLAIFGILQDVTPTRVVITTSPQFAGLPHQLSINNVTDLAGNPIDPVMTIFIGL